MKVGRRLAIKMLNAARFALMQAEPRGPITEPLDRGMLTALASAGRRVDRAARGLRLRPRARADRDVLLGVLRRLPRAGEERGATATSDRKRRRRPTARCSWRCRRCCGCSRRTCRSSPKRSGRGGGPARCTARRGRPRLRSSRRSAVADTQALAVREATQAALAEVRRIKSMLKKPVKAVIARAVLPMAYRGPGARGARLPGRHAHPRSRVRRRGRSRSSSSRKTPSRRRRAREAGPVRAARSRRLPRAGSPRAGRGLRLGRRHHRSGHRPRQKARAVILAKSPCVIAGPRHRLRGVPPARSGRHRHGQARGR